MLFSNCTKSRLNLFNNYEFLSAFARKCVFIGVPYSERSSVQKGDAREARVPK